MLIDSQRCAFSGDTDFDTHIVALSQADQLILLDLDLLDLLQVIGGREHFLEMPRLQT